MEQVTVKDGQTLFDVAVQEFGSWEAAIDIAWANSVSLTDMLAAGALLMLPEGLSVNRTMQLWCSQHGVSPATARAVSGVTVGVFSKEFTDEFE